MEKLYLGEFEETVLTMVAIIGQEAYGNRIVNEIKERLDRSVNVSAVHITLYRLEDKGLVKSSMGGVTSIRGGRRKRFFEVTHTGFAFLRNIRDQRNDLWARIPELGFSNQ